LSWLQDGQRIAAVLASADYHAGRRPLNSTPRAVSRPESRDSARVPASQTRPWRDTSGPVPQLTPDRLPESDPQLLPISLKKRHGSDTKGIADTLRGQITDRQRVEWRASTPKDWANES
jgi:hypothetical protein